MGKKWWVKNGLQNNDLQNNISYLQNSSQKKIRAICDLKNLPNSYAPHYSANHYSTTKIKLSGLVSTLFADVGFSLVVVGGSAVEFYTEGGYMSGDIDFCRREVHHIPLRLAQDVMAELSATGGPRSWQVCGLFVDMLGFLENESTSPMRTVETPYGTVTLVPRELALVERVLAAYYPQMSEAAMDKGISITWEEWKAGRAAKREALRKLGLDAPSRRNSSSSDKRLHRAFGGKRAPDLSVSPRDGKD